MKWLSVTGTGLAITAVGLAVACGGGGAKPSREVTVDDLAQMVLQREDVPAEFRQLLGEREGRGLRQNGEAGALASYITVFDLPSEEVKPGTTVCIVTSTSLYANAEDAQAVLRGEIEELERGFEEEGEGFEIQRVPSPRLGHESIGVRFLSPHASFCGYENEPTEAHLIMFQSWNVVGGLGVFVNERGASLDEAIELAQTQANRIEAIFEGDDS